MKKRKKQEKAITLVALVITIILLLILASISIQAITNTGLFESAFKAREEAQRAQVTEWLNLKLMEEQMLKPTGTAEQIIEATRVASKGNTELAKMGKKVVVDESTSTLEDGEQVPVYFYVQVDEDVYKVEMSGAKFIGEEGKFPPVITIESLTKTTNSIKIKIKVSRNEGGELIIYKKKDNEATYTVEKEATGDEVTGLEHTFEGLEQNKNYSIKIVATAKNGQIKEYIKDVPLGSVPELTTADTTFTYKVNGQVIDKATWTNQNVTVTVNTTITGYTLQTSTNGQNWSNETSRTFTQNGTVHARLCDGKNGGKALSANVTNIDKLNPKAFTPQTSRTTKSITVTASTTDAEATDTSGKSGIAGYRFKLDSGSWSNYQTSGTYTWDNLEQKTNHTITVEAKDNAGNTTTGTATKGTTTIEQPTTATYTPTTWTSGSITVTLPTKTGYTIRYTTNGTVPTKTSTEYSGPFTVSSNCVINFAYSDGINVGKAQAANVTNIDTTKPEVTEVTSTTNSISITATDELSGIVGYAVTTSNTAPSSFTSCTNTKTLSTTVTGKTQNTKYYVWVKDQVGHVSTGREIKTQIQYVTSISLNKTSETLNVGSTVTLTATVNPSNANNKNVTWSSNNTSVATVSNGVVTAKTAGTATITATAQDGSGKSATCTVTVKVPSSVEPTTATTHTATAITYSWADLSTIAKMISNNSSIGSDTAEVKVTLNGTTKTIGVGDTATVDGQTVRILGFNHDILTTKTAYDGETTATEKAGISFEYVTFLTTAQMNGSSTNSGGWGSCALKGTLNGTTYNSLSIKSYIKQVQKEYIKTYNSASSKTYSSDYLWLLSCGEIWNNGYNGGVTRGYAIATEGSQYKYYKSTLGNTSYSSKTNVTVKQNSYWWLRSPYYDTSYTFCRVYSNGRCSNSGAHYSGGVAPGFSI